MKHATEWLKRYPPTAKKIVKRYIRYYGVSLEVAISELKVLQIEVTDKQIAYYNETLIHPKHKKKKHHNMITEQEAYGFYYVAGYTANGMPYGITIEAAIEQGLLEQEKDL